MTDDNLHDIDGTDDKKHQQHRVEECNIDDIQTDAIRELARDWDDEGRILEAGCQMGQRDIVYDVGTGVSVYEDGSEYVADDGGDRSVRTDNPRDAAQVAIGYVDEAEEERIADTFSKFFDGFRGFSVVRGRTNKDTPAIKAEREGVSISVSRTTDGQWWVVADADGMPPLSEMYEQPVMVVMTVIEWLDDLED